MKANPIVLHEQSNSFGHGNKGREGERLVKNHGPFHLLTPVNGGTPWIRWHRGEEKHDRESNYKLEEFNLILVVRPPPPPPSSEASQSLVKERRGYNEDVVVSK